MAEEKNAVQQAKTVYGTLCKMLTDKGLKFKSFDEDLTVTFGFKGEDIPVEIIANIDPERLLITMFSQLPFTVPENKRADVALAISMVNCSIVDGSFGFDYNKGTVVFKITSRFNESLIGKSLLEYMMVICYHTVERFNDKFFLIANGKMSLEELQQFIREE